MIHLTLTPDQRDAVQALRRDPTLKPPERDRVEMVLLSAQRWSPPAIGVQLGYCAASVRRILRQFQQNGVAGLRHRPSGPPPDTDRRHQVEAALEILLRQQRTWTAAQLADALSQEDIHLSSRQVRRYLSRMEARYRRTSRTLRHKQDPKRVERARDTLEALKKRLPLAS